jgi:hypothetical protein
MIWGITGSLFIFILIPTPIFMAVYKEATNYAQQNYDSYNNFARAVLGKIGDAIFDATFWTAAATLAIACFTYRLKQATDRLKRSTDNLWEVAKSQLIAANRPWIRTQVINVYIFIVTEQKLSFGVTLQFINTGKSPACNIDYLHHYVAFDYPRLWIRQDDTCKAAEMFRAQMDENRQRNFTIFPNEPDNVEFNFPVETSDVNEFNVRFIGAIDDFIAPILIGCVAYRWDGSPKYFHTMFAYEFGEAGPGGAFMRRPKVIDGPNVRVRRAFTGRNTAD